MTEATPAAAPAAPAAPVPAATTTAAPVDPKAVQAAVVEAVKHKIKLNGQDLEVPEAELVGLLKQVKHRAKVDGKEVEVDYDQLLKDYQLGQGAQKRMMDADVSKRQAEELIKLARTDPRKLLQHPSINADLKAMAEQILSEQIQDQLMDPRDRELRDHKKKIEGYETQLKNQQTQALQQVYQSVVAHLGEPVAQAAVAILQHQKAPITAEAIVSTAQEYVKQQQAIIATVDTAVTAVGLPNTPDARKRVAYYMHQGSLRGLDVTADKAAALAKEDYVSEIKTLLGAAPSEALLSMLGDEMTNKVVKSHLEKHKKPVTQPVTPLDPAKPRVRTERNEGPRKFRSRDEWEASLNERLGK